MRARLLILLTCSVVGSLPGGHVLAHGGGLDANGCHTNRKTGEYHCHGSPRPSREPSAPRSSPPPQRFSDGTSRLRPSTGTPCQASQRQLIQAAQHLLAALGYEVGKADGILRTATVQSIQRFQAEHRLEPTGVVDGALLVALSEEVMVRKGR